MPSGLVILFVGVALVILAVIVALWRYWDSISQRSPEDEAFDRRLAALNERQSNRMSDRFIRADMDQDTAWQIMVERGRRAAQGRERYSGELDRRTRERRTERPGERRAAQERRTRERRGDRP